MAGEFSRRELWMRKIAGEVARAVGARIQAGELTIGAAAPERAVLAADHVTTLGVVDRAFEMLEEEGWLVRDDIGGLRIGQGPSEGTGFAVPETFGETSDDIVAILELRMGVETVAAALAAEHRSDEALAAIEAAADAYARTQADRTRSAQADFEFHHAIATASGNPYILDLLEYLGPLLIPRMRIRVSDPARAEDANLDASIAEHKKLVAAIKARDISGAQGIMRDHLVRSIDMVRNLEAT